MFKNTVFDHQTSPTMTISVLAILFLVTECLLEVRGQCNLENIHNYGFLGALLGSSLAGSDNHNIQVNITNTNIVCLAASPTIGIYRSISIVIRYFCSMQGCPSGKLATSPWGTVLLMGSYSTFYLLELSPLILICFL